MGAMMGATHPVAMGANGLVGALVATGACVAMEAVVVMVAHVVIGVLMVTGDHTIPDIATHLLSSGAIGTAMELWAMLNPEGTCTEQ